LMWTGCIGHFNSTVHLPGGVGNRFLSEALQRVGAQG
jgi:hypothetical protein